MGILDLGDGLTVVDAFDTSRTAKGAVELRCSARAEPAAIRLLRGAAADFAARAGASHDVVEAIRLAVSEAVTNVVMHAYVGAPETGSIAVAAALTGDRIRVTVRDSGGGMRPRPDSPGVGLGLPLMAASADALDVASVRTGGTEIRMAFRLAG